MQWKTLIFCPFKVGDKLWTESEHWKKRFNLNSLEYPEYYVMGVSLDMPLH